MGSDITGTTTTTATEELIDTYGGCRMCKSTSSICLLRPPPLQRGGIMSLVLLAVLAMPGSWGPAGCAPVGAIAIAGYQARSYYEWIPTSDPDQLALYRDGVQIGAWSHEGAYYRSLVAGRWGAKADQAPISPPSRELEKKEKVKAKADPTDLPPPGTIVYTQNFGVDTSKIARDGVRYRVNGRVCTKAEAYEAMDGKVPDDRNKLRLTIIGDESDRKKVMDDWLNDKDLASFRENVLIQVYPPEHWAVSKAGFVTTGKPTIYFQAPNGKVLHRQDDYQGGAALLAEALRKADPNYNPKKDPDRRNDSPGVPWLGNVPWPWLVAGGLVVLLFFTRKRGV